jgi:hypothetical protein
VSVGCSVDVLLFVVLIGVAHIYLVNDYLLDVTHSDNSYYWIFQENELFKHQSEPSNTEMNLLFCINIIMFYCRQMVFGGLV